MPFGGAALAGRSRRSAALLARLGRPALRGLLLRSLGRVRVRPAAAGRPAGRCCCWNQLVSSVSYSGVRPSPAPAGGSASGCTGCAGRLAAARRGAPKSSPSLAPARPAAEVAGPCCGLLLVLLRLGGLRRGRPRRVEVGRASPGEAGGRAPGPWSWRRALAGTVYWPVSDGSWPGARTGRCPRLVAVTVVAARALELPGRRGTLRCRARRTRRGVRTRRCAEDWSCAAARRGPVEVRARRTRRSTPGPWRSSSAGAGTGRCAARAPRGRAARPGPSPAAARGRCPSSRPAAGPAAALRVAAGQLGARGAGRRGDRAVAAARGGRGSGRGRLPKADCWPLGGLPCRAGPAAGRRRGAAARRADPGRR